LHAGAGVQQALLEHWVPLTHLLHCSVVPEGRHESWTGPHVPEARVHVLVGAQQVPTTPLPGAAPGAPVELATHSPPEGQLTVRLPPQPSGSDVPHWLLPL
jgi:hypothetical protein